MSMYIIYTSGKNLCFDPAGSVLQLVTDISIGLENPLFTGAYEYAKPSLLTRVKNKLKRRK